MNRTFIECRVTLGLLGGQCPHPARDRVGSLRAKSVRVKEGALVEGPARGGHGAQRVRRDAVVRGSPYPSRHRRDTFPAGEGSWVGRAQAGLPYGHPASPGRTRPLSGAGGSDLLRRPTEATPAPPAMRQVWRGEAFPFRLYRQRQERSQQPRSPKTAKGVRGGNAPWPRASASRCALREPCPQSTCMTPPRVFSMTGGAQPNREPGVGTAHPQKGLIL